MVGVIFSVHTLIYHSLLCYIQCWLCVHVVKPSYCHGQLSRQLAAVVRWLN